MKKLYFLVLAGTAALAAAAPDHEARAAAATAVNYHGVLQGVMAKVDRDYSQLNPQGQPAPGAIANVETFLTAFNTLGITGAGNYQFFVSGNGNSLVQCAGPASQSCNGIKVLVENAVHPMTLFGAQAAFTYDVVVWMDHGAGYSRFLEGSYTPVAGTPGKGNLTLTDCSGCSTVGHDQIEWDGSVSPAHLRAHMYDTRWNMNANPQPYGNVVLDAVFNQLTGDIKISGAGTNTCDGTAGGDSICGNGGTQNNTTGYSVLLHGNVISGNVFVQGLHDVNSSVLGPSNAADQMCLKADHTQDASGSACAADGSNTFAGMSPYHPADANAFSWGAGQFPFADVTDTPSF